MGYEVVMIRSRPIRAAVAALLLLAGAGPAPADTTHSIEFTYYPVAGRTPGEIYRSIVNRGPKVAGERAIAATSARGVQNYSLQQEGSSCRVVENRVNFRFTVEMPKPTGLASLSARDRSLWQQFTAFLKAHELQHTRLWLRCAADLDRKVLGIKTGNCKDAAQEAEDLWRKMKTACDKKQVRFDSEQRAELLAQPFMQRVMRGD